MWEPEADTFHYCSEAGAAHALGTDLDPCAVPAVEDNKAANGIAPGDFTMLIGNIIDDETVQQTAGRERYDLVTANILADVLIPLTPVVGRHLKPGGIYITSGILDIKELEVREAVEAAGLRCWRLLVRESGYPSQPENERKTEMYRFFVSPEQLAEGWSGLRERMCTISEMCSVCGRESRS